LLKAEGSLSTYLPLSTFHLQPTIVDGEIVWDYPDFIDRIGDSEAVAVTGFVQGTVMGTEMRGSMKGVFEFWSDLKPPYVLGPPSAICRADDHAVILRRKQ
jgi:hypothetical protein